MRRGEKDRRRRKKLITSTPTNKGVNKEKKRKRVGIRRKRESQSGRLGGKSRRKLFEDSLGKGLELVLEKSEKARVQVTSLKGRGNRENRRDAEKAFVGKFNLMIIPASGNDLHRKDRTEVET